MFTEKNILVIGGTGTIGQEIVNTILRQQPRVVRIYSRDEYKQFVMAESLRGYNNVRYLIGDVRDKARLDRAMQGIDIVFDLAAMKHVPACEYNPFEAVQTNVIGTQNVIECAINNKVERVIYTSSDKSVSPTNTYGATKLLAERLISSGDFSKGGGGPTFAAVRFGNVLGARGSVIPLWKEQIRSKRTITLTNGEMTRFMMTIPQAVNLLFRACEQAKGGEVFVFKMPVMKLSDLAKVIVESECKKLNISSNMVNISTIGLRPGEKMYEELMTAHESSSAIEYDDMFAILSNNKLNDLHWDVKMAKLSNYSSHTEVPLSTMNIREMLASANLI